MEIQDDKLNIEEVQQLTSKLANFIFDIYDFRVAKLHKKT